MQKIVTILFCSLLLFECGGDSDQAQKDFEKRIIGNWWRCKLILDTSVVYNHKDAGESNDIIIFDGNFLNEYYNYTSTVTKLHTWTYTFDGNFLIRHSDLGNAGMGWVSYSNDTLLIERGSAGTRQRSCFLKYNGSLPPPQWPQTIEKDTIR